MMFKYGKKCTEQIQCQAEKCLGETTKLDQIIAQKPRPQCLQISGTALVLLTIGVVVVILCRHYLKDLLEWLQNLPAWAGILLFIVMFTIVSFPMTWGYIVLNFAAGYLYGFTIGLIVVALSATFGVSTAFIVCRRFFRDYVRSKLESDGLKAIIRVVEGRRGFKVITLSRLTPIPFGLQNGLFAVSNVKMCRYVAASSIGLLPTQALNAYIGSTLRSMEDVMADHSSSYLILVAQVLISIALTVYVIRRARKELNKTCEESESEIQANGDIVAGPKFLPQLANNHSLEYDIEAQVHKDRTKVIKGHKRAHSASAILMDVHEIHDNEVHTP